MTSAPQAVPGNRWDLAVASLRPPDDVAVVIPYFDQPDSLARLYAALRADPADERFEVVVIDDGSALSPPPPPEELKARVTVLRQDDRGCRPGAARNLGVAASAAETLVFLDADTLPEPGTIGRLARWPASVADALVVGRRRHADLERWSGDDVYRWLTGEGGAPTPRRDPEWLAAGYRDTADLLRADSRSYRFIISAVMSCDRSLFDDVGGFSDQRDRYGGEDWELASRAYNAGAVLVHDRQAIAWHDEPDVTDRNDQDVDKTEETLWLAAHLRDPHARPAALRMERHRWRIAVDLDPAVGVAEWVATLDAVLGDLSDADVVLGRHAPAAVRSFTSHDPRIRTGWSRADAVADVVVIAAVTFEPGTLRAWVERLVERDLGTLDVTDDEGLLLRIESHRALGRRRRQQRRGSAPGTWFADETVIAGAAARRLHGHLALARYFDTRAR